MVMMVLLKLHSDNDCKYSNISAFGEPQYP